MSFDHPDENQTRSWLALWFIRQREMNIEGMESMLSPEYIDIWWWTLQRATQPHHITAAKGALERTLQKAGLVSYPPERPSEAAMRLAQNDGRYD